VNTTLRAVFVSLVVAAFVLIAAPASAQLPESSTQMKLAKDAAFLERVQYLMVQAARVVLAEPLNTACHTQRAAYARGVKDNPAQWAVHASVMLVGGVNLIGTVTVNAGPPETVSTTVTDAALFSQINTFWSALAGCDTGS
jgi:hypothetical protein